MKVLILGYDVDTSNLLKDFGYTGIQSESHLRGALNHIPGKDLIVFLGGADINPGLYGEENNGSYYNNTSTIRDYMEKEVWQYAKQLNIPCFGICRGFQFMNVMNNGKMRQDVPNHTGNYGHHPIMDNTGTELFYVNSYHHQQVVIDNMLEVTDVLYAPPKEYITEVESAIWPNTLSAGVQWHPEWMESDEDGRLYVEKILCKLQNLREWKAGTL